MNTTTTILSQGKSYTFIAIIHEITDPSRLFLDREKFYKEKEHGPLLLPHHEIEITQTEEGFFEKCVLHISWEPKKHRSFVCYPKRIATTEEAKDILRTWCAGSVCTFEGGPDLNKTFKGNYGEFYLLMKNTYHIVVDGASGGD